MLDNRKDTWVFVLIFCTLLIVYAPAVLVPYVYHDDVLFWAKLPGQHTLHYFHSFLSSSGRFIDAWMLSGVGLLINSVSDLNILRFFSVLILSLCAFLFWKWLKQYHSNFRDSFLLSIGIFLLPAFQVIIGWVSACFDAVSVLLSILAAWSVSKYDFQNPKKYIFHDKNIITAVLLLVFSFSIYQSAATFYWVMPATLLLSPKQKDSPHLLKKVIVLSIVGILGMLAYGMVLEIAKGKLKQYYFYNPHMFATDYIGKFKWFLQEPIVNSFNLWNIFPKISIAVILSGIIFIAFLHKIFNHIRNAKMKQEYAFKNQTFLLYSLALPCFIVLSFLPNLLVNKNYGMYRCCAPLTAIILLVLVWALNDFMPLFTKVVRARLFTFVLAIACIYGAWQAEKNLLYYRVIPSYLEYNYVKFKLRQVLSGHFKAIHFICPRWELMKGRYDEFGIFTTCAPENILPLVICAIQELAREDHIDFCGLVYNPDNKMALFYFRENNIGKTDVGSAYPVLLTNDFEDESPKIDSFATMVINTQKLTEILAKQERTFNIR